MTVVVVRRIAGRTTGCSLGISADWVIDAGRPVRRRRPGQLRRDGAGARARPRAQPAAPPGPAEPDVPGSSPPDGLRGAALHPWQEAILHASRHVVRGRQPAEPAPRPPLRWSGAILALPARARNPRHWPTPLRLYDSATGEECGPPIRVKVATMYVCGITPYDATHLGHAATYLASDLVRMWLDASHQVHYVQNITDIDDPLLERAQRDGVSWRKLADREIGLFRDDMTALRVIPPADYIGAVEAMDEVTAAVQELIDSRRRLPGTRRAVPRRCTSTSPPPGSSATSRATTRRRSAAVRRTRRRPRPARQAAAAGSAAVAGRTAAGAVLVLADGSRPAGLAHRVCGHHRQPDRAGHRSAGRRQRPDLPASRVFGRARRGALRRAAVRPALHTRRHDRAGRRRCPSRGA